MKIKRYVNPEEKKAKKTLGKTFLPQDIDTSILKVIKYEYEENPIEIEHTTSEFTCLCPFSELPDYAQITIRYVPNKYLIELRSLKYYLFAFRQVKIFHEHAVNKIMQDLVKVLKPKKLEVEGIFNIRGGIKTRVVAKYPLENDQSTDS